MTWRWPLVWRTTMEFQRERAEVAYRLLGCERTSKAAVGFELERVQKDRRVLRERLDAFLKPPLVGATDQRYPEAALIGASGANKTAFTEAGVRFLEAVKKPVKPAKKPRKRRAP